MPLHPIIESWFASKGWAPRAHQLEVLEATAAGASALLIAPTGAGKTLAGFLPTLDDLIANPMPGLHTLYLSPLKALAVDVQRNLVTPIEEMGVGIKVETRTGDTPASRRQRQRYDPPNILLTTPEQLALLLSHPDAHRMFGSLRRIVLDELHALVTNKRGELLALGIARLATLAPALRITALSATVARPDLLRDWIAAPLPEAEARLLTAAGGAPPELSILATEARVPWAGHSAQYAIPELYEIIRQHGTTLLFVNTRSQAEMLFQNLWQINEAGLAIAMHHGSLAVEQRRRVESAMAAGRLQAVVCTSTLDLGIDWGDVDLVVQIGAPKGSSRMLQRIGRANHRLDEPSKALFVPSNRFEVLECEAALEAVAAGHQDSEDPVSGGLDVLAQHVLGMACAAPFDPVDLHAEVRRAWEQNDAAVRRWLKEEYPRLRREAKREGAAIYWGDEMGLRSDHSVGRSFSPKGKTPVIKGTGQRFGCNMISAITNQGALSFMVFRENFTVAVFLRFLRRLIRQNERRVYLIVDGHPVHRAKLVQAWLEKHSERIRMVRLPGYSPELNPDEMLNQDVKSNALGRERPASRPELIQRVRSYLHRRQRQPHIVRRYFDEYHVRYAAA